MALKFAANLNFLFTESATSIAERIRLAHKHGFRAVEIPYPAGELEEVVKATKETGIVVSLVNIATDQTSHELKFGTASIPGSEQLFKRQLDDTIEFAKSVNCKKIHLMAGIVSKKTDHAHLGVYMANLKIAANSLKNNNLIGVIEPINKYAVPHYYLNSYEKASEVLTGIQCGGIKLMIDIYHLQHIKGNITNTLDEFKNQIGHFQIAQVPNRNEPDTKGELNYEYLFEKLVEFGYDDWIGCEYKPKTTTTEGLNWVEKYGFKL